MMRCVRSARTRRALIAPGVTTVVAVDADAVVGFAQMFSDGELQAFLTTCCAWMARCSTLPGASSRTCSARPAMWRRVEDVEGFRVVSCVHGPA